MATNNLFQVIFFCKNNRHTYPPHIQNIPKLYRGQVKGFRIAIYLAFCSFFDTFVSRETFYLLCKISKMRKSSKPVLFTVISASRRPEPTPTLTIPAAFIASIPA